MAHSTGPGPQTTMDTVLSRIRETYRDMTPTCRVAADYVLEHHKELAFASVARIGKLAGISPATIVRFAEHLGLAGYSELQALARAALRQEVDTVSQLKRSSRDSEPSSLLAATLRADMANLERTLDQVSDATFTTAVEWLAGATTVHLVGLRSTYGLVRHLAFYLDWIGRNPKVLQPGIGDLPEQIMKVKPGDVCVALSFRRYTRDTIEIFRAARRAGAKTIALTDSELSPLAEHADLTLAISVQFLTFFESRVAVLSIMNALVYGIALADRNHTLEALQGHETAWLANGTYANEHFRTRFKAEIAAFAATEPMPTGAVRTKRGKHRRLTRTSNAGGPPRRGNNAPV
jgi:DNA-binding MurR/RpiR family transcriptional regulator